MNKLLLTALLATLPFTAIAHETRSADLTIQHPWSRVMPAASVNGAAYFLIENTGKQADRLLGAQTPRAKKAELHTHIHDNGVMRMREVEGGVAVPAGQTVKFAPGGLHVMLMGLNSPLQKGEHFPLTLKFERGGEVKLDVVVEDGMPAAMPMQH
ncbi:copper chaperone PCu(A)C [Craterilacuibacter sinensis]|uniref:Copper chaperone PCu(A)C n=1 Tax=Craterilacuibacter sinensis TaxID=2686017 RepID=A0A845BMD0_9NEIS|nr:copper chaperone PCu(A)C [Craterilacuibacter sinensis]MXR36434.1 copper chaperone PCu(A)C [Craterilacuibacter sinensis]RQW28491.1 copper chaperone PCu(A)C [Rhodobacteraceae bacterium CH30]